MMNEVSEQAPPQLSDKTKLLRAARMIGFILLYAFAEVEIAGLIPDSWREAVRSDETNALLLACGMTLSMMLIIYIGGIDFTGFTAEWRQQLFGVVAFFWSIKTAWLIAYLLGRWLVPDTENEGVAFLFFILGCLVLLPFQAIAMRAYAKRKGIPIWPNIPRA